VSAKWNYQIYSLLRVLNIVIILEEVVDTVQAMARLPARAIKVRRHVLVHPELVSKVDRCHYTDVFQSVDLLTETVKTSLE